WPAVFTRRRVRAPIFRHLLVCQRPDDRLGKNLLNEEVVFQNHLLTGVTADRLQYRAHPHTVPMILALRARDRFHECDPFYRVAMPVRTVKAQARAPVVEDKGDALANAQSLKQRFEVATMLDEPIRAGPAVGKLVGIPHSDQVRRNAAAQRLQIRYDVAPQVRRGGVAVQQYDGVALSDLHVRHLAIEYAPPLLLVGKCRGNHVRSFSRTLRKYRYCLRNDEAPQHSDEF